MAKKPKTGKKLTKATRLSAIANTTRKKLPG